MATLVTTCRKGDTLLQILSFSTSLRMLNNYVLATVAIEDLPF